MSQERIAGGLDNKTHSSGRYAEAPRGIRRFSSVAAARLGRLCVRRRPGNYFTAEQRDLLAKTGLDLSDLPFGAPFSGAEDLRPVAVSLREHFGRQTEGCGVKLSVPTAALQDHLSRTDGEAAMAYQDRSGGWVIPHAEDSAFKKSEQREGVETTPGRLILGRGAVAAAIGSHIRSEDGSDTFMPMVTQFDGPVLHYLDPGTPPQFIDPKLTQ